MSATSPAVSAGFRKSDCAMPIQESLMRLFPIAQGVECVTIALPSPLWRG